MDGCVRFADPRFVPTTEDVLMSRVRTTGIVENEFVVEAPWNRQIRLFDLGGTRNERKKWLHCFEGVDVVWFIAAISEYNQVGSGRCVCDCPLLLSSFSLTCHLCLSVVT